jgi:hypothetical protein
MEDEPLFPSEANKLIFPELAAIIQNETPTIPAVWTMQILSIPVELSWAVRLRLPLWRAASVEVINGSGSSLGDGRKLWCWVERLVASNPSMPSVKSFSIKFFGIASIESVNVVEPGLTGLSVSQPDIIHKKNAGTIIEKRNRQFIVYTPYYLTFFSFHFKAASSTVISFE